MPSVENWDKIEIVKMPQKHTDLTTYRGFIYFEGKTIGIVEYDWTHSEESRKKALEYVLSMVLKT
jgi:hypothetical protein